jgi:hypothetical protein
MLQLDENNYKTRLLRIDRARQVRHAKYINGHWVRFRTGISAIYKHIPFKDGMTVVEMGSKLPYFTCELPVHFNIKVTICCPEIKELGMGRNCNNRSIRTLAV